ncbi:MAG TPA: hypothetical protein VK077_00855 [Virgibacillus sp.]|nr:hypothetical protein [Virgibacillus sp.]
MKNKRMMIGIGSFLFTMFVLLPVLKMLGVPSFNHVLTYLFGKPTVWSKTVVSIGLIVFIGAWVLFLFRGNQKDNEHT